MAKVKQFLNVLSGWQTANIKSFPIAVDADKAGTEDEGDLLQLKQGDWVKFDVDGNLVIADSYDGSFAVFPVYAGNVSFYDTKYHGRADVVTARSGIIETNATEADGILAGEAVTVADGKIVGGASSANAIGFAIEKQKDDRTLKIQLI